MMLLMFGVMFLLIALELPIAFALVCAAFFYLHVGTEIPPSIVVQRMSTGVDSFPLLAIPLFVLAGNLLNSGGIARRLFDFSIALIGHMRGGLAQVNILASLIFSGMSGVAQADAAGLGTVEIKAMKSAGFDPAFAAAISASSAIIGPIIPPSVIMVIYSLMTETNIGAMFAAGVIPGILATVLLMVAVAWQTRRNPAAGPRGDRTPWPERWRALRGIWGVVVLFVLVMGGIYGGAFTVTEGAAIGAFGAFIFALARRSLTWAVLAQVLVESARTTAMLFTILIGALIFANFVNFTSMPQDLKDYVEQFQLSPMTVIFLICAIYVLLGTAMEELSMILLTVPVLFPLVVHLGFDPLWFGVLVVVVVEIGLISPPVGMNIFVLRTLLPNVSTGTIYRGVTPFVIADIVRLIILISLPILSTWLPHLLF